MQLLAKTFKGLEDVLAQELTELGANDIQKERRAVSFTGDALSGELVSPDRFSCVSAYCDLSRQGCGCCV